MHLPNARSDVRGHSPGRRGAIPIVILVFLGVDNEERVVVVEKRQARSLARSDPIEVGDQREQVSPAKRDLCAHRGHEVHPHSYTRPRGREPDLLIEGATRAGRKACLKTSKTAR
jgi:hypothetical protein